MKMKPRQVEELSKAIITDARTMFTDWEIPMDKYTGLIVFNAVTCTVYFTHITTGAVLVLNDVFFNEKTGKILQCVHSFR